MANLGHTIGLESPIVNLQITYQRGLLATGFKYEYGVQWVQTLPAEPTHFGKESVFNYTLSSPNLFSIYIYSAPPFRQWQ